AASSSLEDCGPPRQLLGEQPTQRSQYRLLVVAITDRISGAACEERQAPDRLVLRDPVGELDRGRDLCRIRRRSRGDAARGLLPGQADDQIDRRVLLRILVPERGVKAEHDRPLADVVCDGRPLTDQLGVDELGHLPDDLEWADSRAVRAEVRPAPPVEYDTGV